MNQMPVAAEFLPHVPRAVSKQAGYVFTGKVMDKCAAIETWAVHILDQLRISASNPPKPKPQFLGLKLGTIKTCAESEPKLFRRPADVIRLLNDLEPLIDLRSRLAHGVLDVATRADGDLVFIFGSSCAEPKMPGGGRLVFRECDMRDAASRLANLANQLCQQMLNATAKPSH